MISNTLDTHDIVGVCQIWEQEIACGVVSTKKIKVEKKRCLFLNSVNKDQA